MKYKEQKRLSLQGLAAGGRSVGLFLASPPQFLPIVLFLKGFYFYFNKIR